MTTITKQIVLGSDDCREMNTTYINDYSDYIYVGRIYSFVYSMGLRWQTMNIPRDAAIRSAKLSIYATELFGDFKATIRGVAEDDTATWTQTGRPSQRQSTVATVSANPEKWANLDVGHWDWASIDVTTIIQEIVQREGWHPSNALALIIDPDFSCDNAYLGATTYEYDSALSAKIEISYDVTLDTGLVLYAPFNEGTGTSARDDSGCGNIVTLQNMDDTDWVTGISGYAVEFNGTNEYVDCGYADRLRLNDAFTISFWYKMATFVHTWPGILVKGDSSTAHGMLLWYDSNGVLYFSRNNGWQENTTSGAITTSWKHFVFVYSPGSWAWYVNGALNASGSITYPTSTSTDRLYLGSGDEYGNGSLDEFREYNRALTPAEVKWLYDHPSSTLVDHPSGRACFTDLNGNGHTISDMISLDVSSELSDAADSFSMELLNTGNRYSWLERGCEVEIGIGMDGINTQKLTGVVLDVERHLDGDDYPFISVSGEDWGYKLNHLFFSGRFYDLELSDLLEAILDSTDYSSSKTWQELAGLSSDYSNIDSTAFSIDVASYKWKSLSAAVKEIADTAGFEWYVDVDKKVHLFDAGATDISATITDSDLVAPPSLTDEGDIVNRAIVVGGYEQILDQSGGFAWDEVTVTDTSSYNQSFVPTQEFLSSVKIGTKLIAGSSSGMTLSIQADSGGSPSGDSLSNGFLELALDSVDDVALTEFRFSNVVTLTPGDTYWLVVYGTDATGQKVFELSSVLFHKTYWQSRVMILSEDAVSQETYGMCMCAPYVDNKMEDSELAEQTANNMLVLSSKTVASLELHGTAINSGDVVRLNLATVGVAVDKTMKVVSSSWCVGERFVNNSLELKEI